MSNDLFMGIDVSKGYADFIIIDRDRNIIEDNFQLDDTFNGHNSLFKILSDVLSNNDNATLYCAVESTGGLENNWLNFLYRLKDVLNIKAARINPIGPVALKKAAMKRNGTDAISAYSIADYLIVYPNKISYNVQDPYVVLRRQYGMIEMFNKQLTQLLNQFQNLLYISMPFLLPYCKHGIPNWVLQLLSAYPSADKISRAQVSSIARIRYISLKRAEIIIQKAKLNVGAQTDENMADIIKTMAKEIIHLKKLIEQNKKSLIKHCDLPEIKILTSFKSIGKYSAIGLLLNIVSIERFPSAKHLASYFGLHPVYKDSGDTSGNYKMSKKGRSAPRKILFMVARNAIRYNPLIKQVYIEHLKRGKTKMSALGACMHKILRIVYGMLKNNTAFDPEVDKRNRNKIRIVNSKKKVNNKRRYQPIADDAPISRRQTKKRKENQPQTVLDGMCGVKVSPSVV